MGVKEKHPTDFHWHLGENEWIRGKNEYFQSFPFHYPHYHKGGVGSGETNDGHKNKLDLTLSAFPK